MMMTTDQVDIEDIAQGLSMTARFRGQTREFYSVAQHSVMVARALPPVLGLAGLLHDAGEAYLFDCARPIKRFVQFRGEHASFVESMASRERRVLETVFAACGVLWPTGDGWEAITDADLRALMTEARDLMGPPPEPWGIVASPYRATVVPLTWREARCVFLDTFRSLTSGVAG